MKLQGSSFRGKGKKKVVPGRIARRFFFTSTSTGFVDPGKPRRTASCKTSNGKKGMPMGKYNTRVPMKV